MQLNTFVPSHMRTTLDMPDDVMRRAKITAIERGSTLRQLVIDALQREMACATTPRRRLDRAPVKLTANAPLRTLGLDEIKRLDAAAVAADDEAKALALHR